MLRVGTIAAARRDDRCLSLLSQRHQKYACSNKTRGVFARKTKTKKTNRQEQQPTPPQQFTSRGSRAFDLNALWRLKQHHGKPPPSVISRCDRRELCSRWWLLSAVYVRSIKVSLLLLAKKTLKKHRTAAVAGRCLQSICRGSRVCDHGAFSRPKYLTRAASVIS